MSTLALGLAMSVAQGQTATISSMSAAGQSTPIEAAAAAVWMRPTACIRSCDPSPTRRCS